MNYWPVNVAVENTIVQYLETQISGSEASIYAGEQNVDKQAPCIIVSVQSARELVPGTRFYECDTVIQTKEMAADLAPSGSTMGILAADAFNAFFDPNYQTNFNNNSYSCSFVFIQQTDNRHEVREDAIVNEMSFNIRASQI